MALFQCVPQCDFDNIEPVRVSADGDGYYYYSAYQYFLADDDNDRGPHTAFAWSNLPESQRKAFHRQEAADRARAYNERNKMIRAIVDSPVHDAFVTTLEPTLIIGVASNLTVYYAYSRPTDTIWIYSHPEEVIDIVLTSDNFTWAANLPPDAVQLAQRMRHLFLLREFRYWHSDVAYAM